jgi:drug/metabolite transporter (DMT)-like permease
MDTDIRKCAVCGTGEMRVVSTTPQARERFLCGTCGHETEIDTTGSIGAETGLAVVASLAIGFVLWAGKGLSRGEAVVVALVFAGFLAPALIALWQRRRHPVLRQEPRSAPPETTRGNTIETPIPGVLRRARFLTGLLAVIGFVVLWFLFWGGIGLLREL